jgi:hypothetical protein
VDKKALRARYWERPAPCRRQLQGNAMNFDEAEQTTMLRDAAALR